MSQLKGPREYHIVVLGPGGVGKSCLTMQFVQGVFVERYDPTIEDSYRKHITVDGRSVVLEIMDTAGTEQFTAMRDMYLRLGQGFLLVYSITSPASLRDLRDLREQIVRAKGDAAFPMVLVGSKSDLEDERAVPSERAYALSQRWGGVPCYETSARRATNINEVFIDLCRQIIRRDLRMRRQSDDQSQHSTQVKKKRPAESRAIDNRAIDNREDDRGPKCTIL